MAVTVAVGLHPAILRAGSMHVVDSTEVHVGPCDANRIDFSLETRGGVTQSERKGRREDAEKVHQGEQPSGPNASRISQSRKHATSGPKKRRSEYNFSATVKQSARDPGFGSHIDEGHTPVHRPGGD